MHMCWHICFEFGCVVGVRVIQGSQGCKNVLPGGETSGSEFQGEGPFLTYVVYKSYQNPPEVQRYD